MRAYMKKSVLVIAAMAMLAGCSNTTNGSRTGDKQTIGTLLGAAGGAVLGSNVGHGKGNIASIAVGTLLGAYMGSEIGSSLDKADLSYANGTAQNAFETAPSGQASTWRNPDSGNSGTVVPTSTYKTSQGQYCREYQQTVTVQGQTQQAYGTACRQPDGSWKIMN